jgi:hypothetical protein
MIGERFARRPLALERAYRLCDGRRLLGRQFVLSRSRLQIFELELHLIQQPRHALRARPVKLTPQFLDRQLEMDDQRFRVRVHGLGAGRNRLGF